MNHVLLWKEYRQQRIIWLAIVLLAIFTVVVVAVALGQGTGLEVFRDGSIRPTLITIILALAVTYGIVSGALLLAGEKEDRTLDFLDGLAGKRGPVWRQKASAGALFTLALGVAMALLVTVLGFGSWRTGLILLYWCLDGLAWGLLGGALCNKVLLAVLAGIACMASSWLLALFVNTSMALYLGKAMLAGAAVLYSRQIFCRDDPSRQAAPPKSRFTIPLPAGWRVLLWLSFRQGRWVLVGGLTFAVALGLTVSLAPLFLWPIGSLVLGLVCGLAAFCPDQGDGSRFLGAHRFSPDRIWPVKILFWAVSTILLCALAWQVGVAALFHQDPNASMENWWEKWLGSLYARDHILVHLTPGLFLLLWPLYGFCFAQFFGLTASRPILGGILATIFAALSVASWVPSLFFGGVPAWQFLAIPLILLATSRLVMWPWMSGRLLTGKPLLGTACAMALVVLAMAGFLWHRAVEVPDVGEPFDVNAFVASLPSLEQNEAGRLIHRAGAAMREHEKKVEERIKPPTEPIFPRDNVPTENLRVRDYYEFCHQVLQKGWPKKGKELGHWLDLIFQGEWANQAAKAARLALGLVIDPRTTTLQTRLPLEDQCYQMVVFFTCRALQLQAHGDSRSALQQFESALGLSRQMRNNSPQGAYLTGWRMEATVLGGIDHWLKNVGPDQKLLRELLTLLQNHEAAIPDPAGSIKAQFLIVRNSEPVVRKTERWSGRYDSILEAMQRTAFLTPWENERQNRIVRAATLGQLRLVQKPVWQTPDWKQFDHLSGMALVRGLPPEDGPGSNLSARRWGEYLQQSWFERSYSLAYIIPGMRKRPELHALQIVTAVALFQADKGKPPTTLDQLVPNYLPTLPIDPNNGKSFDYRISKGEEINGFFPSGAEVNIRLAPGQALVWSEGSLYKFPVPVWKK